MSAVWMVRVSGQSYGPYTDAQMASFAAEGRVMPQSMIAREGESAFRLAGEEPALAHLFPDRAPGPSDKENVLHHPKAVFGRPKNDARQQEERARLLILTDMKSGSIGDIEDAIHKMGQACPLFPQAWLLRTDQTANAVRNTLVLKLGKLDRIFVVDASHDKAAWFNFSPEAEARFRRLWSRESTEAAPDKQALP